MNTSLEQLQAGQLAGARHVKLACGLTEFPRDLFDLADTLEVLDLSGNALSTLPADLPRLSKLRILFASNNRFTELPDVLGECAQLSMIGFRANRIRVVSAKSLPPLLRWLILTDNEIEALPEELGDRPCLQKLMLAGNRLRALPASMAACTHLGLVRLSANRFDALPDWLFRLPRLAWLAYAGNPFSAALEASASVDPLVADVQWQTLTLEDRLGEGASGVIYRARQQGGEGGRGEGRQVAVKLFKGAVTSDGLPDCEMAACMHATNHPNLIPVLGKVQGHPEGQHGLVLALIDPAFGNLAGPPSMVSCTRDVYADDLRFDLASALRMAHGMASAAAHLHRRGIMHGDLYAHNILHCGKGRALLGDFGAASFFDVDDTARGLALQRLEVLAFGHLLEELLARSEPPVGFDTSDLHALREACQSLTPEARPVFDAVAGRLQACLGMLHGEA